MLKHLQHRAKTLFRRSAPHKIHAKDLPEAGALVVSYPKCGRTWLRLMLGRYLCQQYKLDPKRALETLYLTHQAGLLPTHFTHDGVKTREDAWRPTAPDASRYAKKRVLLLMRDPRDVVVSSYFQATKRENGYDGTLSDFIRDPNHGLSAYLDFLTLWEKNAEVPEKFLVMRYKNIHTDPAGHLRTLLSFVDCTKIDEAAVEEAVNYASFNNMQKLEKANYFRTKRLAPGNVNDPESFKVRRGKIGGYKDYLNAEDCAFIEQSIEQSPCSFVQSYSNIAKTLAFSAVAFCELLYIDYQTIISGLLPEFV